MASVLEYRNFLEKGTYIFNSKNLVNTLKPFFNDTLAGLPTATTKFGIEIVIIEQAPIRFFSLSNNLVYFQFG